jgi:hypothetical protein
MIQPPPQGVWPSLHTASLWTLAINAGLLIGAIMRPLGAGQSIDWGGMVLGHGIVLAIIAAPLGLGWLAAAMPQAKVWGSLDTLFFRTVRASLFMVGFVILYLGINIVMFKMPVSPWVIGALLSASMTLAWYGFLRFGPWARPSNQPKS